MKCKPLTIGLDISGLEVLYPSTSRTNDPSIISHYSTLGYSMFRLLIRWEKLQPSLVNSLSGTITNSVTFDVDYLNEILSYVAECTSNKVTCLIELDNGGWYDVSYDASFVNDGSLPCPSSNYVYIGQSQTTINGASYVGPTVTQFSNFWITLAGSTSNSVALSDNPYVRFGLGQKTTLDNSLWIPIMNTTISNLRGASITNRLYVDMQNSSIDNISGFSNITDTSNNTVFNVNYSNDANSGSGTSVLSEDAYLMAAMTGVSFIRGLGNSSKMSFGDVRFDAGSTSITALEKFLSYVENNIDAFESVCLFAIGDSQNIPSYYDLNYTSTTTNGTTSIVDVPQITTAMNLPTSIDLTTSVSELTGTTLTYVQDSPFGASYQSLESGQLYIPYEVITNTMPDFTVEFFFKRIANDTSTGYLFGASNSLGLWFDTSNLYMQLGDTSYVKFTVNDLYNDGEWHHYEVDVSPSNIILFVDGVMVAKSILSSVKNLDPQFDASFLGILSNSNSSTNNSEITGYISNVIIWGITLHTASFTVPASYYIGNEDGLLFNLKLDGDLISYVNQGN